MAGASGSLLDQGVAIWCSDLSNGPPHGRNNCPFILAGSCGGYFRQGEMVNITASDPNLRNVLHTIGEAVGVPASVLSGFGDPSVPGGSLAELRA